MKPFDGHALRGSGLYSIGEPVEGLCTARLLRLEFHGVLYHLTPRGDRQEPIRKGIIVKAIQAGAKTFEMISRRTGAGTGPCGAQRCGPMIRGMLGEEVETCRECGWSILKGSSPLVCPRCGAEQNLG